MDIIVRADIYIINGDFPSHSLSHQVKKTLCDFASRHIRLVAHHYDSKSEILQFSDGLTDSIVENKFFKISWGGRMAISKYNFVNHPIPVEKNSPLLHLTDSHFISETF